MIKKKRCRPNYILVNNVKTHFEAKDAGEVGAWYGKIHGVTFSHHLDE